MKRHRPLHALLATALATVCFAGVALAQAPPATPPAASATQDIRDIRGPKPLEPSWLLPALAGALAVGAGAGCAVWALRRRRKLRVKQPHEIALDRLESARSFMQEGGSREFSIVVSGIVRDYIENAFGIVATHLTTHEFLSELLQSSHDAVARSRPLLADFLESCDLAKFGGWNLTLPAMNDMYLSARRFVVESAAAQAQQGDADSLLPQSTPIMPGDTYDSLPTT